MEFFHIIVLSLVQGITELLPISSSGHLILVPNIMAWADQGPELDVMMHVGSMLAILLYFWRDVVHLLHGFLKVVGLKFQSAEAKLFLHLVVASIPATIVGFLIHKFAGDALRNPHLVAFTLIFYGLVLYAADRFSRQTQTFENMTIKSALIFGVFQCLALVPGTSRSGICMTAGRLMGFTRLEAARFAFLMAIPTIAGAGLLKSVELYKKGSAELIHDALLTGFFTFLVSYGAIAFMMTWLRKSGFLPFVIYRVALGLFLIYWFFV